MLHARPDYQARIQDSANLIPPDMPVFLLLGKDQHAAATVRYWADRVELSGGDPEIVRMARAHAVKMDALAEHKQPDLPEVFVVCKTDPDCFLADGHAGEHDHVPF